MWLLKRNPPKDELYPTEDLYFGGSVTPQGLFDFLIWQHEAVHTEFIEVRLTDGVLKGRALSADLMIWLGAVEGDLLSALTSRPGPRRFFAELAIRVGALVTPAQVPAFTRALTPLDLRGFFLLCAALETTARESYARMEKLTDALIGSRTGDVARSLQLENLSRELRLKTLDETFHEQAFLEMAGWVVNGQLDPTLTERACADRLATHLPRGAKSIHDPNIAHVITHGGLSSLFEARGLSIVVQ